MKKIAVVLFNLGGPDLPKSVQPFLFNLFNDKAIISAPQPIRWFIAKLISTRRAPIAREIYKNLGGKSPLLELTKQQAEALEEKLNMSTGAKYKVFISMRYWHPMSAECVSQVKEWGADEEILLPLYPQYSTTTTGSSFVDWQKNAKKQGLNLPTAKIGCYPTQEDFISAHVDLLKESYSKALKNGKPRVLFSAHGLPQKIVDAGDPYQNHVEKTAAAIVEKLAIDDLDFAICYQSKVGPLEWLKPSTENEIARAGADNVPIVILPIAFVSEHSETLVELDIEYKELAAEKGVSCYERVPALGVHESYIKGLAKICLQAVAGKTSSDTGARICPKKFGKCICDGLS